jgi:hypothetical protein
MTIEQYLKNIDNARKRKDATEHTYRSDLKLLIESIVPDIIATNEPKRQTCGAPDYKLTKDNITKGYIEAKNIGDKDLEGKNPKINKLQFDRYKQTKDQYIFTDYIDFHFYKDAIFITKVKIADIVNDKLIPVTDNFELFKNLIKQFCTNVSQSIKNPKELAEMMAGKARLLSIEIENAINNDLQNNVKSSLTIQLDEFKKILINDITVKKFSDIYSQTISYGLFAARLHDPTLPSFSRHEAAELIPKSNPFLRKLFGYIAGPELDDRIRWIVEALVDIFLACNVEEIIKKHGNTTQKEDPIIHFYETFLKEYDPKLRKAMGVWYTPSSVVNFIIKSVDEALINDFSLPLGLADSTKIKLKTDQQGRQVEKEVHKVQVLDPATGTGTFLAETIKHIHNKFLNQKGIWTSYVEKNLIPRLNGFEILMASYAMAHLKLDLLLTETGFNNTLNQRFKVYLTNTLEESHPDTGTIFANWLSDEANEANHIKRDSPIMCIIGNPPYSVSSNNNNKWIRNLIADYKKGLNEKKINLDDDYIKFIRHGQYLIDKNESGILAYISNNSFIDGITHRQMRLSLLESFDKLYILDLHGNAKKQEVSPDGTVDQNVFDIMQGVSINLFIKTNHKRKGELGKVFHSDLYGARELKYEYLNNHTISNVKWKELNLDSQNYFFVPKDFSKISIYEKGFKLNELFLVSNSGISTDRDPLFLAENSSFLEKRIPELLSNDYSIDFKSFYNVNDSSGYPLLKRIKNKKFNKNYISDYHYRPFDFRKIYFDDTIISRPAKEVMRHIHNKENIALLAPRQVTNDFHHVFVSNKICDGNITSSARLFGAGKVFPLYLYSEHNQIQQTTDAKRVPNLEEKIVKKISNKLQLDFTFEKGNESTTFSPIDILDYIYAVLNSKKYCEKFKEFLKIDFPRVPYPKDKEQFWQLVKLGSSLRHLHLLDGNYAQKCQTQYLIDGNNIISKIFYIDNKIYINEKQNFNNVLPDVWNFYIGSYQPAQKWLKERLNKSPLSYEDISHYMNILHTISESIIVINEINKIDF